jgi:hypothetical protein
VAVPRPSLRTTFIGVVVAVVGLHLASVTLAALPPNRYSDAVRGQTSYLDPYFTQNWRLFAPSPISEDRELLFQAAYVDADGQARRTPWLDWTAVELDLVRHRLIGGRAGYVTNKLVSPLKSRADALSSAQRIAATSSPQVDPISWTDLSDELAAAGAPAAVRLGYLRYDRTATRLATDALMARHPDLELTAVRYAIRRQGVVPYAARGGSAAERRVARPAAVRDVGGWRRPTPGSAAELAAVRDFDRRHR